MREENAEHPRAAISLARQAGERGDGSYGARPVVAHGAMSAEVANRLGTGRDRAGHAKLTLTRQAWDCLEPAVRAGCVVCAAALSWSGISRVVYAIDADRVAPLLWATRDLALDCWLVLAHGRRPVAVIGPLLADQAARVFTHVQS